MSKYSLPSISTKSTLCYILTGILKLLQPFMPFVTAEIYSMLPTKEKEDLMICDYPKYNKDYIFLEEEKLVDDQVLFIKNFRNTKVENNITKDMKVMFDNNEDITLIVNMLKINDNLIKEPLTIKSYKVLSNNYKATIFFEKIETPEDKNIKEKQINTLKESIARREKLLSNINYVSKAPENIVNADRKKLAEEKKILEELLK